MISNKDKFINWEEEIFWSRERNQIEWEEEQEYQQLKITLAKTWSREPKVWTTKVPRFVKNTKRFSRY